MLLVSRRLSATGIRFSVILFPPGSWAFLTVGLPVNETGPRRGYHVPHARAATGLGALCTPGTAVLIPTDKGSSATAPAASLRRVPAPRYRIPSRGANFDGASTRVQAIHPSGLPLTCGRRMERLPLGFPPSFEPHRLITGDARQGGDRP